MEEFETRITALGDPAEVADALGGQVQHHDAFANAGGQPGSNDGIGDRGETPDHMAAVQDRRSARGSLPDHRGT